MLQNNLTLLFLVPAAYVFNNVMVLHALVFLI